MGKISLVSAKYIIHINIQVDGVVDRPDVIGAIFGQTEGLLGSDLEMRELQRSGRIGRIDVKIETRGGKSEGEIIIPTSLSKSETVLIGAAVETIQRIGPCDAKVRVESVEDVRVSKRRYVVDRAKELLKKLTEDVLPDSQELTDEVTQSVSMMEIREYGTDRLPAGPAIDENEEIIVVEGRADILNMLKHGIKNVIALNGTSVPNTIRELSRKKSITLFVDGDRGGDLIIREVSGAAEIDFVVKAPDGKEVEELTKKEILKALRGKVAIEQVKLEKAEILDTKGGMVERTVTRVRTVPVRNVNRVSVVNERAKDFKKMLDELIGTRGAYILDESFNILGKVPVSELTSTLRSLNSGVFAIVFDGVINRELASAAERINVQYLVGMDSRLRDGETKVKVITAEQI